MEDYYFIACVIDHKICMFPHRGQRTTLASFSDTRRWSYCIFRNLCQHHEICRRYYRQTYRPLMMDRLIHFVAEKTLQILENGSFLWNLFSYASINYKYVYTQKNMKSKANKISGKCNNLEDFNLKKIKHFKCFMRGKIIKIFFCGWDFYAKCSHMSVT